MNEYIYRSYSSTIYVTSIFSLVWKYSKKYVGMLFRFVFYHILLDNSISNLQKSNLKHFIHAIDKITKQNPIKEQKFPLFKKLQNSSTK